MARYDRDLFVIGAGSGGVRAARMAGGLGARVAIAEERYLGGTCVNVGCIPKKLLVYGSHFAHDFRDAGGFGWTVRNATFDWSTLIAQKDREVARLNGIYGRLLEQSGVVVHEARAIVLDPHTVEVDGRRITAERILIASGGWPKRPVVPGCDLAITSNEAFHLESLPKRVVIVGGGYIGVEFACIFHRLGSRVTLVHRKPQPLRGFDEEVRLFLHDRMRHDGVAMRMARTLSRIDRTEGGLEATLSDGHVIAADVVMLATGRTPNTAGLGLEEAGVMLGPRGEVAVDVHYRTNVPSVFAIGDVTDRMQLTPVAIHEAIAFVNTEFGGTPTVLDYDNIPTAVFSQPNVGTVGLTEERAHHVCPRVQTFRSVFTPLKHTLTGQPDKTLMKLVVDAENGRVVGVHMVGPDAGEIIQGFAVALNAGATKETFDRTLGIHPTSAEELVTMRG